jgi:hypothetical protein
MEIEYLLCSGKIEIKGRKNKKVGMIFIESLLHAKLIES